MIGLREAMIGLIPLTNVALMSVRTLRRSEVYV
jgi:hypothetical protein